MSDQFVVGIDFATTRIDVALLPWNGGSVYGARWIHVALRGTGARGEMRWFYACLRVPEGLSERIDWRLVHMCAIELPVGPGSRRLLPLMGAITHAIPPSAAPAPIAPQEWKRLFCGDGHASKVDVADKARGLGFPPDWPQDAYDALGIAWAWRIRAREAVAAVGERA